MNLRSYLPFLFIAFGCISVSTTYALSYPISTPAGETAGGTYRTYFDNMFSSEIDCYGSGRVVGGFNSVGVPFCVIPAPTGLNILGAVLGDTLRYNGTDWVRNNLLYNNGTGIGVGMQSPAYLFDVGGTANFIGIRMPTGAGSGRVLVSDTSGVASWSDLAPSVTSSGILGGTEDYITKYGIGGVGLVLSQIFDTGTGVGIANTNPQYLFDVSGTGNFIGLRLPTGAGSGKVLTSDASGNMYWSSSLSGASASGIVGGIENYITKFGTGGTGLVASQIFDTGGSIGIGTNTPIAGYKVDISGGDVLINTLTVGRGGGGVLSNIAFGWNALGSNSIATTSTALGYSALASLTIGGGNVAVGNLAGSTLISGSNNIFIGENTQPTTSTISNQLNIGNWIYGSGGNIGIGTATPGSRLTVSGSFQLLNGTQAAGRILMSDASGIATWQPAGAASNAWLLTGNAGTNSGSFLGTIDGEDLRFRTNNTEKMFIGTGGNVGIGTSSPGAKLEVAGTIKITGGSPGLGKILTSDATGLATWSTGFSGATTASGITGGSSGYLSVFGAGGNGLYSSRIFQTGSFIGIGTATPGYTLDVAGTGNFLGLRLPTGATNGYVLTTDASGNASWTVPTLITGGQANYIPRWLSSTTLGTGALFQSGSNIGISNTNPGYTLDVSGTANITGFRFPTGAALGRMLISDATGNASWTGSIIATDFSLSGAVLGATPYYNGTNWVSGVNIYNTGGNVGIGTSSPGAKLEVAGTIKITGGSPGLGKILTSDATGLATWSTGFSGATTASGITGGSSGYLSVFGAGGNGLYSSRIFQTGSFIGIGTATPGYTLDVAGTGNFLGLRLPTGATNGYVLTTDASGNASWTVPTLITGGQANYIPRWLSSTTLGTGALFQSGSNIGISNTNPGYTLDVSGTGNFLGLRLPTGASAGRVLTSDASGNAIWSATISGATATGITGGTQNYLPKFGTGGNGLYISQIFDNGTNVGIGTASPGVYRLNVNGSSYFSGDVTVVGRLITDTIVNRTVNNVTISGSILPDSGAPLIYRDIGSTSQRWNNLYLSGQIAIGGGSPGLGKILTSDATGLATWSTGFSGATTASGITGGSSGYLSVFGAGGNGLYSSRIFQTGSFIGIGTATPGYTLDVAGTGNFLGLRLPTGATNGYVLTTDASGNASWTVPTLITGGQANYIPRWLSSTTLGTGALFQSGSNIGISNTNPGYTLDVSGTANITGFRFPTGAALGRMLISDATGNASWTGSIIATDFSLSGAVLGATPYYNGTNWVSGVNIYNTGGNVGIGTSSPGAKLEVAGTIKITGGSPGLGKILTSDATGLATWSTGFSGATTASGITGGSSGYLSVFGAGGNGLYSSRIFQTGSFIGIGTATPGYTLDVAGTGSFDGLHLPTGAALGRILTTDASGNVSWTSGFSGSTSASGITGGTANYVTKFGTGGNGLVNSQIFDNGTNVGVGTGANLTAKFTIDSGVNNTSGLRLPRIIATTPVFSGVAAPLGVDGSGNVVVAQQGAIPVYTALGATPNAAINTSTNPPTIGANYDKYFTINARQSFTVTDVGGNPHNCPEFNLGSINKGTTGCTQTPYASYVMTAQNATSGDRYAYQILISDRVDAPFVVRGGMYDESAGNLMNTAMTVPALWFKAITVPTNRSEWLYVNPGVDVNNNPISGGGNVGLGTMTPSSKFEIWSGSTSNSTFAHFRGTNNVAFGQGAVKSNLSGNANTGIGSEALFTLTSGYSNTAIGHKALRSTDSGFFNTAIGQESLHTNAGGSWGTAVGYQALYSNSTGTGNIGIGGQALYNLTLGSNNIGIGYQALRVIAGSSVANNIGIGFQALYSATTSNLTAIGYQALYSNSSGTGNTAVGYQSLDSVTTTSGNTGLGFATLGATTGSNNTAIGTNAGDALTSGSNNIVIGSQVDLISNTESNQLNIGNWIYGSGGKIGIGTSSLNTNAVLKVGGQIEITGGTPGVGKVLTSNANGLATWETPSGGGGGGGGSGWLLTGNAGTVAGTNYIGTSDAVDFVIGTNNTEKMRVESGGDVGIGTNNPGSKLDVNGTFKLGTNGTQITSMGVCTTGTITISNSASLQNCTGIPASTNVVISCSSTNGAFSNAAATLYCRPNGTLNQMLCNTSAANTNPRIFKCMWMQ